ncbi:MAG: hypothetical protein JKY37_07080 [Nannocystaceae bacterium]|nr:hypothetical protein [Nannocystaceae bacterium]
MSRLTTVTALLSLGLLPACDAEPVFDGAASHFANESSPASSSELFAPGHGRDVIPIARLRCGGDDCLPTGTASIPLEGRDRLRAAYFDIAGYPDETTHRSHTEGEHDAVRLGVWAAVRGQLAGVNAVFSEAGIAECRDVRADESYSLKRATLDTSQGTRLIPDRFTNPGKLLEHHIEVSTKTSALRASVDFSCDFPVSYGEFEFESRSGPYHVKAWWSTPLRNETEIELIAEVGPFIYAGSFATDGEGVEAALISVHRQDGFESGTRTVLHSDAEGRAASAYQQYFARDTSLFASPKTHSAEVKGSETNASRQCASWADNAPVFQEGTCEGLEYSAPLPTVFGSDQELSIAWAAAPAKQGGLLDLLEEGI